jgi:hypothetical protein
VSDNSSTEEMWHWGESPSHGGLTKHRGKRESCPAPDCLDWRSNYQSSTEETARRLADAATPGPWAQDGPYWLTADDCSTVITAGPERVAIAVEPRAFERSPRYRADAEFIAWCRTGVPALLDLLAAVRADERTRIATEQERTEERCCGICVGRCEVVRRDEEASADLPDERGLVNGLCACPIWPSGLPCTIVGNHIGPHAHHGQSGAPSVPVGAVLDLVEPGGQQ